MAKYHISALIVAILLSPALNAADVNLGPEVPLSNTLQANGQLDPAIALGPNGVFAVWSDAKRLGLSGALNGGAAMSIDGNGIDLVGWPAVAAGNHVFLVVWRHNVSGALDLVLGRRFDFNGNALDPQPLVLDENHGSESFQYPTNTTTPAIAFDGSSFLVVWTHIFTGTPSADTATLYTVRVGEEGLPFGARTVLDAVMATSGFSMGLAGARAFWTGSEFFVPYTRRFSSAENPYFVYSSLAVLRLSNDAIVNQGPLLFGLQGRAESDRVAATLVGSRVTYAWVRSIQDGADLVAAQTRIDGQILFSPTLIMSQHVAGALMQTPNVIWDGSEYVVVWLEAPNAVSLPTKLRAIRLDTGFGRIDAQPFDISSGQSLAYQPWLIKTASGVAIAYLRNDAANGGLGRAFLRTLDAPPPAVLPDLTFAGGGLTVTPKDINPGDTVTVSYQIQNAGPAGAGSTTTNITIKPSAGGAIVAQGNFATPAVPADGVIAESRDLTISRFAVAGAYTFTVTLNADGAIAENDTTNNTAVFFGSPPSVQPPPPPCTFTFDRNEIDFAAAGGSVSIQVTANDPTCHWTVIQDRGNAWLTITPSEGTGNGQITFTAAPNPTAETRSTTVTIGNRTVAVRQAPAAPARRRSAHP